MSVQLHAFTCGWLTIPRAFMLAGEDGVIKVPIPSYLVTHPKGRVLFDTGLHAATLDDPTAHVGEMLARYHEFDFSPGEEIGARLNISPKTVSNVLSLARQKLGVGSDLALAQLAARAGLIDWSA